jgi:hypothetical protein
MTFIIYMTLTCLSVVSPYLCLVNDCRLLMKKKVFHNSKVLAWLCLALIGITSVTLSVIYSIDKTYYWQVTLIINFVCALVIEVVVFESVKCFFAHFLLPYYMFRAEVGRGGGGGRGATLPFTFATLEVTSCTRCLRLYLKYSRVMHTTVKPNVIPTTTLAANSSLLRIRMAMIQGRAEWMATLWQLGGTAAKTVSTHLLVTLQRSLHRISEWESKGEGGTRCAHLAPHCPGEVGWCDCTMALSMSCGYWLATAVET